MKLKGKQKTYLRGLGSQLTPTVFIGKEGISEAILRSLDEAHSNTELVKIRIARGCPLDQQEVGQVIVNSTQSELVQILGRTLLFYRSQDEPTIELPK